MLNSDLRTEVLTALAGNFKAARLRADLTQERLALNAKVSLRMVHKIERGEANPSAVTLTKLAREMDVQVGELFQGVG